MLTFRFIRLGVNFFLRIKPRSQLSEAENVPLYWTNSRKICKAFSFIVKPVIQQLAARSSIGPI
jgi:hypothetical protein